MRALPLLALLLAPPAAAAPPVAAVAFAPDGRLAAGLVGEVALFAPDRAPAGTLTGQDARVSALAFSSGGALAVASGRPSESGVVRLYDAGQQSPRDTIAAHQDTVLALSWSPDGRTLATAGYDRAVKLWDVQSSPAKLKHTLTDHSDSVYAVAFHPGGKLLATGAADRAVKVWDAATGKRLYTLSEPTDWVYSVAWRGDLLYAGGVDRSLRVWRAGEQGGQLLAAAVAHAGPILRVCADGAAPGVATLSEDGFVKVWDGESLAPRAASGRVPGPLAAAFGPDGVLAVGRFDGTLELRDAAAPGVGPVATLLPAPPTLIAVGPDAVVRGEAATVTLTGTHLDRLTAVKASRDGVKVTLLPSKNPNERRATLVPGSAVGPFVLTGVAATGEVPGPTLWVDRFPAAPASGVVRLPASVPGVVERPGRVGRVEVELKAGEELGVELSTGAGKFEPVLAVTDAMGRPLAEAEGSKLGFTAPGAGRYAVTARDRQFGGAPGFTYRLHLGPVPVVAGVFPLEVAAGATSEVRVVGVHLGSGARAAVTPPPGAKPGDAVPVPGSGKSVTVGEFPAALVQNGAAELPAVPMAADGVLDAPGATQRVSFPARKGRRLALEVVAARRGSPVDSTLTILDSAGKPVPRALLRAVARLVTTFRDHSARATGVRLESWNELAVDDYLYADGDLMRVAELPATPDSDAIFYARGGRRQSFLGTTPNDIPTGTPLYKVEFHPPGSAFSPNGLPAAELPYRNDDELGADSFLLFDPPADGVYTALVGDARGAGGPAHAYRLVVREPRPRFTLSVSPKTPKVFAGGAVPLTVTATRLDGYGGPIRVNFDAPAGFSAPETLIEAGQESAVVPLAASADAKPGALTALGRGEVDGKPLTATAATGELTTRGNPDYRVATDRRAVSIRPGGTAKLEIEVARKPGFKGRAQCEVRGLPHGVMVIDLGLNGVLIPGGQTRRTVVLRADPWVKPLRVPFAVVGKQEGQKAEFAAPAVELVVE